MIGEFTTETGCHVYLTVQEPEGADEGAIFQNWRMTNPRDGRWVQLKLAADEARTLAGALLSAADRLSPPKPLPRAEHKPPAKPRRGKQETGDSQ